MGKGRHPLTDCKGQCCLERKKIALSGSLMQSWKNDWV